MTTIKLPWMFLISELEKEYKDPEIVLRELKRYGRKEQVRITMELSEKVNVEKLRKEIEEEVK